LVTHALMGMLALASAGGAGPARADDTGVLVDAGKTIATVPEGIFSAGYNGWHDITHPSAVRALNDIGIRFLRIDVDLGQICGERSGDFRWEYTVPRDVGLGFVSRVKKLIDNGWVPVLAFSTCRSMPAWFRGEEGNVAKTWFKYNRDGSPAADGIGDQYEEFSHLAETIATGLSERGLQGLHWETIYELGADMPLADIHYFAARGIRQADLSARVMGPATWPGWTVRERFLKPFLGKYGAELLDYVTVHWYATCTHELWDAGFKPEETILTMADHKYLTYCMEIAPQYADWCRQLRELLDDPELNPTGKRIGIAFTEFDVNAYSPYMRTPANPDWPKYRADADCYVNTNYFGGVWCAEVLLGMAATGCVDIAMKFNTRSYYGLVENRPEGGYMRQPIWFAWKLLQQAGGFRPGAAMLHTQVEGPRDEGVGHVKRAGNLPWVSAYALGSSDDLRIVLINRSLDAQRVDVRVQRLAQDRGDMAARRYRFSQQRVAAFIGRRPDQKGDGHFEGYPEDSANEEALRELDSVPVTWEARTGMLAGLTCPGISVTVLVLGASAEPAKGGKVRPSAEEN